MSSKDFGPTKNCLALLLGLTLGTHRGQLDTSCWCMPCKLELVAMRCDARTCSAPRELVRLLKARQKEH